MSKYRRVASSPTTTDIQDDLSAESFAFAGDHLSQYQEYVEGPDETLEFLFSEASFLRLHLAVNDAQTL